MEDAHDEYPLIPPTRADTLKVQVIPGHTSTSATFLIANEDHTLGNALRYVLMRDAHTAMCGYSLPHPSEELVNLRLQTRALEGEAPEGADVVRVFRKGLRDLQDMAKIMEDALDAAGEGGGEEVPPGEREGGKPRAERTVHLRSFPAEKREEDDERGEGEEGEHHAAVGEGAEGGEGPAGKPAVARVEGGLGGEEGAVGEEDEGGGGEFGPDKDGVKEQEPGENEGGGGGVRVAFGEAEPAEEDPEGGNPEELKPDAGSGAGFVVTDVEGAKGGEGDEGEAGLERGAVAAQPVTARGLG